MLGKRSRIYVESSIQAVSIILIEKLLIKFPRVSGKIERFYGTIVEESLFGKDPDVAEDVQDNKANVEAIARRRRRNEVCMSLKRSSIIHNTYILKNIVEILILASYIPFNVYFSLDAQRNLQPSQCVINILEFPQLFTTTARPRRCDSSSGCSTSRSWRSPSCSSAASHPSRGASGSGASRNC